MNRFRLPISIAGAALAAACVTASPADAATRYAGPASKDATGGCATAADACALEHAIEGAAANDEVIVLPGTYDVGLAAIAPAQPITVRGIDAANRPTIIGQTPALTGAVLEVVAGSSLRDLRVESRSDATAIELKGGVVGERLIGIVSGATGSAKGIQMKDATNLLRDSLAVSNAPTGAALQIKDGTNTVTGVTAVGTNGADGLATKIISGSASVKSSILIGAYDSETSQGSNPTIALSNWRPANSIGGADGGGNQDRAPSFCSTRGLYYPAPGSVTIDAGAADSAASTDIDGRSRSLGGAADIGSYEYDDGGCPPEPQGSSTGDGSDPGQTTDPEPDATPTGSGQLPPETDPVLGATVTLGVTRGALTVRLPGSGRFVALTADSTVPVGSVVDATKGTVELTSVRDRSGRTQTGTFSGGAFKIAQDRKGVTELALAGGKFTRCSTTRRGRVVAAGRRPAAVRRLWGRDRGGRFRTRGRNGSATVRGTRWLTEDRCDGTYFKVTEGAIDVRDDRARKTVRLKKGKSYLAAAAAARKKRS